MLSLFPQSSEIQKKHEQLSRKEQEKVLFAEKLTSLISEELQKGIDGTICSKIFRLSAKKESRPLPTITWLYSTTRRSIRIISQPIRRETVAHTSFPAPDVGCVDSWLVLFDNWRFIPLESTACVGLVCWLVVSVIVFSRAFRRLPVAFFVPSISSCDCKLFCSALYRPFS